MAAIYVGCSSAQFARISFQCAAVARTEQKCETEREREGEEEGERGRPTADLRIVVISLCVLLTVHIVLIRKSHHVFFQQLNIDERHLFAVA